MPEALIYDTIRTPRGRGKANGALHEVKPVALVSGLLRELATRNPGLDPSDIDDVVLGVVSPLGDQGGDIARTAVLTSGMPEIVPGVQLNRFCASGLEAVNQAAARVRAGWDDLIVAGGVESMSRVPIGSDGGALAHDPLTNYEIGFVPQGIGADLIATIEGWTREDVDAFAVESQNRAARAVAEGYFERSLVPVRDRNGVTILDREEFVRPGTTIETLAALAPSFAKMGEAGFDAVALEKYVDVPRIDHVHHAGNSSGIVDGAALVVIGSEDAGRRHGLRPRGRVVSTAVVGSDPTIMLTAPGPASLKALARAQLTVEDLDLVEINEAFASVAMRLMRDLGDFPHERTNVNGGAIAMGHPLGATGAMLVGTLLDELERREQRYGLATLCVGAGMGIATIVERL